MGYRKIWIKNYACLSHLGYMKITLRVTELLRSCLFYRHPYKHMLLMSYVIADIWHNLPFMSYVSNEIWHQFHMVLWVSRDRKDLSYSAPGFKLTKNKNFLQKNLKTKKTKISFINFGRWGEKFKTFFWKTKKTCSTNPSFKMMFDNPCM